VAQDELPALLLDMPLDSMHLHAYTAQQQEQRSHPEKPPSFENMCGRLYIPLVHIPRPEFLPPEPRKDMFPAEEDSRLNISATVTGAGRSMPASMRKIYTTQGNLVLRKEGYGTSVNFKVCLLTSANNISIFTDKPDTLPLKIIRGFETPTCFTRFFKASLSGMESRKPWKNAFLPTKMVSSQCTWPSSLPT
jgi:hypothetical protein